MSTTVLLADRETKTRGFLERQLIQDGFRLAAPDRRPDVVLAGDEAALARWRGAAPVIVLGRPDADAADRVRAFRHGCDDYVSRPFHYDELVERIHAVVRRAGARARETVVAGPIEVDVRTRVVSVKGTPLVLSQKEYALLLRLAADPHRVFTKEQLLRDVWEYRASSRTRTLDSHACRLRRKLRALDAETPLVENVWGVGYRLLGLLAGQPVGER